MLSGIINCLYCHFTVASEIEKVFTVLFNLTRVPRFSIIVMFMRQEDRRCVQNLMEFLDQHDKALPEDIKKQYFL